MTYRIFIFSITLVEMGFHSELSRHEFLFSSTVCLAQYRIVNVLDLFTECIKMSDDDR